MSVSSVLDSCLRNRGSARYLCISPLHLEHVFADYRKVVPFINEDQPMYPHIAKSVEFLQNNKVD